MKVDRRITKVTVEFNDEEDGWNLIGLDNNNNPIQILGSDAGEPEDKMLVRDLE